MSGLWVELIYIKTIIILFNFELNTSLNRVDILIFEIMVIKKENKSSLIRWILLKNIHGVIISI